MNIRKIPWPIYGLQLKQIPREIVAISLFISLSDMIIGINNPILSLYARSLGASLTLIGTLTFTLGMTRLLSAVGIGALSDRRGRRTFLVGGISASIVASLLYSLVPGPGWLLPIQVLMGLGIVGTISVALAYATDVVSEQRRGLALGIMATMMGLGYAVGAFLGGNLAGLLGYPATYRFAALVGAVAFLIAWRVLPDDRPARTGETHMRILFRAQIRAMIRDPLIRAASLGSLLDNMVFGGLILTFFPVYAYGLGITQATIGTMFGTRALMSTAARLPTGVLTTRFPSQGLMVAGLALQMSAVFLLPAARSPFWMLAFLIAEGIGYGMFIISGQATIVKRSGDAGRGAGLGMYQSAASIGESLAPLALGILADAVGIRPLFYLVGILVALGILTMVRILRK